MANQQCQSTEGITYQSQTRMWANAQRDGRPAEYRWRPLFKAAKFGWRPLLECSAVMLPRCETCWNLQGCPKLANSRLKFTILWGHVEEVSVFNTFFLIVDTCLSCKDTARQSCGMMPKWRFFCVLYLQRAACSTFHMHSKFALRPHHVWKYGRHRICDRWD